MRSLLLLCLTTFAACGPMSAPTLAPQPNATLAPVTVLVDPPPGPFNDVVTVTLSSSRQNGVVFVSTEGRDPRTSTIGRVSGQRVTVTLDKTTKLRFFASIEKEPDSELQEGEWVRAGGPKGSISGVLVVGSFATNADIGLTRNGQTRQLAPTPTPTEIPFRYTGLASGTHALRGIMDRDRNGVLIPFLDYEGATTNVVLDLNDPFKAGPEGVRVYLGASGSGLGAIAGTIDLPKPPAFQQLRISALSGNLLAAAGNPTALLTQLQNGYQVITNNTDTRYPYIITDLTPGQYTPVPALIGFSSGGVAFNLIAKPLSPVTVLADQTTTANFAFGPVGIKGSVTLPASAIPQNELPIGIVAGRTIALTGDVQAVIMPIILSRDAATNTVRGNYAGTAFRGNTNIDLKVFAGTSGITSALTWLLNVTGGGSADATAQVGVDDVTQDIVVP